MGHQPKNSQNHSVAKKYESKHIKEITEESAEFSMVSKDNVINMLAHLTESNTEDQQSSCARLDSNLSTKEEQEEDTQKLNQDVAKLYIIDSLDDSLVHLNTDKKKKKFLTESR